MTEIFFFIVWNLDSIHKCQGKNPGRLVGHPADDNRLLHQHRNPPIEEVVHVNGVFDLDDMGLRFCQRTQLLIQQGRMVAVGLGDAGLSLGETSDLLGFIVGDNLPGP
ncbi:hypothetical protein C2E25_04185 [Geothermobacter hydrogeniphilus]|uniref:Uncharacterized protein n=1 Tax=Geothermobacter hydrogeniphilus TaxID=1969733 RepID=A0A2K2HCI2_9BACT|nr:hypothetical protein C2E25_04185 [Geothermobacter hydrogeniphilus]